MNKFLLTEFLNEHPFAQDTIVKVIEDKSQNSFINIAVYYEDKIFNGKKSIFALFINNHMAMPTINMPCSVDVDDVVNISKSILQEYAEIVENNLNNKESKVYFNDNKSENLYINKDYIFKSLNIWDDKYGYKSQRHKEETHKLIINMLRECFDGDDSDMDYIDDLIEYIKTTFKK